MSEIKWWHMPDGAEIKWWHMPDGAERDRERETHLREWVRHGEAMGGGGDSDYAFLFRLIDEARNPLRMVDEEGV